MQQLSYRRHRIPPLIIQHAVWLYLRFTLSYRDVQELLAERGIDVSNETIRRWVLKFGRLYAQRLRRSRPKPDDRWHLDKMFVTIRGKRMYLWRAVDSEGEILDFLIQSKRNKAAALKLMRKLLKTHGFAPRVVVTDKLRSYASAFRDLGLSARHEQGVRKIIEQKIHTGRCDDVSEKCSVSSPPDQRGAFSPSTPPSTTTSTSSVT